MLPFCCSMAPGRTVVVQPLSINLIRLLLPFASMHSTRPLSLSLSSCYQMQRQYNLIFQSTLIFFFFAIPVSVPISLRTFFCVSFCSFKGGNISSFKGIQWPCFSDLCQRSYISLERPSFERPLESSVVSFSSCSFPLLFF